MNVTDCRAPELLEKHNTTRSSEEMARAVLFATGPWLLRDAFRAVTGEAGRLAGGYAGAHTVNGTRYMVYELGQWCAPLLTQRCAVVLPLIFARVGYSLRSEPRHACSTLSCTLLSS